MRFELLNMGYGVIAINDTFKYREMLFVPNKDRCIRDGLKTFYNMDAFELDMSEDQQKKYVDEMMDKLPKGDLSLEEVTGID